MDFLKELLLLTVVSAMLCIAFVYITGNTDLIWAVQDVRASDFARWLVNE